MKLWKSSTTSPSHTGQDPPTSLPLRPSVRRSFLDFTAPVNGAPLQNTSKPSSQRTSRPSHPSLQPRQIHLLRFSTTNPPPRRFPPSAAAMSVCELSTLAKSYLSPGVFWTKVRHLPAISSHPSHFSARSGLSWRRRGIPGNSTSRPKSRSCSWGMFSILLLRWTGREMRVRRLRGVGCWCMRDMG